MQILNDTKDKIEKAGTLLTFKSWGITRIDMSYGQKVGDVVIEGNETYKHYILACICSKVGKFYLRNTASTSRKKTTGAIPKSILEAMPIRFVPNARASFEMLVKYVLWLRQNTDLPVNEYVDNDFIAGQFEEVLDAMVFELYFPDSVREKDAEILRYLAPEYGFLPLLPVMTEEEKAQTIYSVYEAYRQKEHEVRNNVILQRMHVPEIIVINSTFNSLFGI